MVRRQLAPVRHDNNMHLFTHVKKLLCGQKEPRLTCVAFTEAPRLALADVETRMNMGQFNGLFKDHASPDRLPNGMQHTQSSPVLPSGPWTISASDRASNVNTEWS
jgi:hypothetical protein